MRLGLLLTMTMVCHAASLYTNRRLASGCVTAVRLRDKWRFLHQGRRPFIRIRRRAFIFRNGVTAHASSVSSVAATSTSSEIQLQTGTGCSRVYGFSYIADHPNAEYSAIRLMGQGIGSHMMSPQLFPHGENVSINSTCDLEGPSGRRQLDIGLRYIVLVLLNGQRIVFSCETRDSNRYVIRSQGFPSPDKDSFLCVHFKPMEDDPFYDYVFSRLNSGVMMDGMLKVIEKGRPIFMHQDCDWFDSPARPEFLYRSGQRSYA
nr:hypothetical protein BaRGS_016039 [Batillaria attramentaria]